MGGLAVWKQRTGVSRGQGSRAQAKFRNQRALRGALHGVRLVSPGGHQDCRWAFTEEKVGGEGDWGLWERPKCIQTSDSPPSAHRDLAGGLAEPRLLGLSPSWSRVQPGHQHFHQVPRQIPLLLVLGAQRTLTCWKGELGCLGLGCSEQGEAAFPGRAHLAAGLPRMSPLPTMEVQGDGKPSPLFRVGHRPPSDKAKTSCIFSYF